MEISLMNDPKFAVFELKFHLNRAIRWISAFGIVFFLWMAFLAQLNNEGMVIFLFFIGFSILELFGFLLSFSNIQVNRKSIIATILYTKYKIDWDEVEAIETDIRSMLGDPYWNTDEIDFDIGSTVVFQGNQKRFPVQIMILGKGKEKFLTFLDELIKERQIQVKPLSSLLVRHKNTKEKHRCKSNTEERSPNKTL